MGIEVLLSVPADTFPDRTAVSDGTTSLSYEQLNTGADALARALTVAGARSLAVLDVNSVAFPVAFFGAAKAGIPLVPLNYRLTDSQLLAQAARLADAVLMTDEAGAGRLVDASFRAVWSRQDVLAHAHSRDPELVEAAVAEPEAALIFTSGTTGAPKLAVLTHDNLTNYILRTVEPLVAEEDEAILVSVPPYHIAGLASVLSSVFAARRIVYLASFDVDGWIDAVRCHGVTQTMVVPTMLQRLLPAIESRGETLPSLRSISYGGGRMPVTVIRRAMELLPHVSFTNAYGLTETSSTISLLGPDDHRAAISSQDPAVRARLGSVGRPLPGIELEVRDSEGRPVPTGEVGEIWVRGDQISGSYRGTPSGLVEGWFRTKDEGRLDEGGYLFLSGRLDDVIVRGGENISPGEIEDVIRELDGIEDVAVIAQPDEAWGEVPVAAIVTVDGDELDESTVQDHVRARLRSSRVPARVVVLDELPYNETGKLLRNVVRERLRDVA